MTKDRIEPIINIEDPLKSAIILHKAGDENYQYDIDEIYEDHIFKIRRYTVNMKFIKYSNGFTEWIDKK